MNILRKTRKSKLIKIDKKRSVSLIFTLIMTVFAWVSYSKVLLPNLNMHIDSWQIVLYTDENKNLQIDEDEDVLIDKEAVTELSFSEIYPGMDTGEEIILIKNLGETNSSINYTINNIKILGNEYAIKDDPDAYLAENPGTYCLKKNEYKTDGDIDTYELINEDNIPFKIVIENINNVDAEGDVGYLKASIDWDANPELAAGLSQNAIDAIVDAKNELDSEWGYNVAKFVEENEGASPIELEIIINATGIPRNNNTNVVDNR